MTRATPFLMIGAAAVLCAPAFAADVGAGQAKAKEICQSCHGLDGVNVTPDAPKLAGQYPDYLEKALRDYQAGRRKNPVMGAMAATLTAKDIENVAAYYSSQPAALDSKPR